MRHLQITSFVIRLIGLALVVHLLRENFDVGLYGDPAFYASATEPSFRFVGIYLLHASRGFYFAAFTVKMLGSLWLFISPHHFARILWAGIAPQDSATTPHRHHHDA